MSVCKYFISLWVVIAVYTLFSLLGGKIGVSAYGQLSRERDRQLSNMEALRLRNEELEGRKNALLYDSDTIAAYARELGYGGGAERFVRIVGLPGTRKQQNNPGQVIMAREPAFIPEFTIRIIAAAAGIGVLVCFLIYDFLVKNRRAL